MPDNFEWQTEEDGRWQEEFAPPNQPVLRRRLPWRSLLTVLLLLLLLLAVARWQISQQVAAANADVQSEVAAAHNFLLSAVQRQDVDLVRSLLSGRDTAWVETQLALIEIDHFGNAPLSGWTAVPPPLANSENVTITLSPDLLTAELQALHAYRFRNAAGVTQTVQLQQTAVYRQGDARWLLAPPMAGFWGNWVTQEGDFITLIYPQRDEAVAQQLLLDLDALVHTICRQMDGLSCPRRYRVQLRLEKEAGSLLTHTDARAGLLMGTNLTLPAPTLIGLPVDEAGYQALFRVYGAQVAAAVITDRVAYQCCDRFMLYWGLLDRQMHQLGLKPLPLAQVDYDYVFARQPYYRLNSLFANFLLASELHWQHLHAFIAFLEQEAVPDLSLADMQRELNDSQTVPDWVLQVTAGRLEPELLETTLLQFLYNRSTSAQTADPPFALPAAEVHLVCEQASGSARIYTFHLETQQGRRLFDYESALPAYTNIRRMPHAPYLYLVIEHRPGEDASRYALVEARAGADSGSIVATFELPVNKANNSIYDVVGSEPHGRFLLLSRWRESAMPEMALLDVAACRGGDCRLTPLDHWQDWSPDGQRTLLSDYAPWQMISALENEQTTFFVDDGHGREEITPGMAPFWLTDAVYGYYEPGEDGLLRLATAVVGQHVPRRLLATADLLAAIPAAQRPAQLTLDWPLVSSQRPSRLFIQAWEAQVADETWPSYFFQVDLSETLDTVESVRLLHESEYLAHVTMSPDGRWLLFNEYRTDSLASRTFLLNPETGRSLDMSDDYGYSTQWSADGRWLLINADNRLLLSAPDANYHKLIFHQFDQCFRYQAYWVE